MKGRALLYVGLAGVLLGLVGVGWGAWQLIGSNVVAQSQQARQTEDLRRTFTQPRPQAKSAEVTIPSLGTDFAVIRIPKIDVTAPVREGIRVRDLKHGVGHYPSSVAPGAVGNFALAGHRTTYGKPFYNIDKLTDGDRIYIETTNATFAYVVIKHEIVSPTEWQVVTQADVAPGQRALTMTSCHPRYSARQRYVVRAELVTS